MRRMLFPVLLAVLALLLVALPVWADRGGNGGGNGVGRGNGQGAPGLSAPPENGANDGDGLGAEPRGQGNAWGHSADRGAQGTPDKPTPEPDSDDPSGCRGRECATQAMARAALRAKGFSLRGTVEAIGEAQLSVRVTNANRAAADLVDEERIATIALNDATLFHLLGGGSGFAVDNVVVGVGDVVGVTGVCVPPDTGSGSEGEWSLLAMRVIVGCLAEVEGAE